MAEHLTANDVPLGTVQYHAVIKTALERVSLSELRMGCGSPLLKDGVDK